jgi:hypothetical protein
VDTCSGHARSNNNRRFWQTPLSMAFRGPDPPKSIFYYLVSALAAPGFGLWARSCTVPADARTFFLSALGFLASRLLLMAPAACAHYAPSSEGPAPVVKASNSMEHGLRSGV